MTQLPEEIAKLIAFAREDSIELRAPAIDGLERTLVSLADKQDKYEDLLNTFFLMANADTEEDLIRLIIKSAARITTAEAATFFKYQPENETLKFSSLAGGGAETLANLEIPAGGGVVGRVVGTKESFMTNDTQNEPLFNPEADKKSGFTTRSILAVPVISKEGNLLGVVESINKKEGDFNDEDLKLLGLLANNVAISHKIFTNVN